MLDSTSLKFNPKTKTYSFIDDEGVYYSFKSSKKFTYYSFLIYEDSAIPNWRDHISNIIQYPFAYCTHDKDKVYDIDNSVIEDRKIHTHVLVALETGTTTYNNMVDQLQPLFLDNGLSCLKNVTSVVGYYNYLIHDTAECRDKHKYQYDPSDRITGNGFDISNYRYITDEEKRKNRKLLIDMIKSGSIKSFQHLLNIAYDMSENEELSDCVIGNQYLFTRLILDQKETNAEKEIKYLHQIIETQTDSIQDLYLQIKILKNKLND